MKKALAILILLSVTLLPVNSHLQADSKTTANFENLMSELGSLAQKFGKLGKNLLKIQQTLNQIARTQHDPTKDVDATAISNSANSIKDIESGCNLTSDILFIGSLAKEKYYSVLVNYLRQSVEYEKQLLERNLKSLRHYDTYIINNDALHTVNKAKAAIQRISELYEETLALLPKENEWEQF
jgi:archaellum component FlaC